MKINTALILCAGFGKRLNPLTLTTPKPLLKLKDITMLERCINLIIELGIKKILLNTFHLENQIIEFIQNNKFPIDIQIVKDGQKFSINKIILIIPLLVTYLIGPLGLFLYWLIRIFYAKNISLYD